MLPQHEAIRRLLEGQQPKFSSDIADQLTAGYGKLDELGCWEFPLPEAIRSCFESYFMRFERHA